MINRLFAFVFIFIVTLVPTFAHAQTPTYLANNGNAQTPSKAYINWIPHSWSTKATREPLKWKNNLPSGSDAMITDAFTLWKSYTAAPAFLAGTKTTSYSSADISITANSCAGNANACVTVIDYHLEPAKTVWSIKKYSIAYPQYNNHSDSKRRDVITHELGHVLGLHDRYSATIACDPQVASSTMLATGCPGFTRTPSTVDSTNIRNLYRFCDQAETWCGKMTFNWLYVNVNGNILASWHNHAWQNYMGIYYWYSKTPGQPYWTAHGPDTSVNNVGFWSDGITWYNNNQEDTYLSTVDGGNARARFGQGKEVLICGKPWTPKQSGWYAPSAYNGYYGLWKCSSFSIIVP